ncbi:secretion protein EspK [Mycobacterium kubicae]|uniref:secretion protein EspK n=1 Tax=Mycobacterium kubicae TaxID=120959 RepID=UPI0007FD21CF|nr:secretion protein EspK [Mycobacterium kubicae]OBF23139.1 secretion protein EspK [Mycobacterium kubicae]
MGIPRPTGEYAGQMLEPGGWPEADEDTLYDRAQEYSQVLRQVTDVMDSTRRQQVEVFDGGVWSGGAANAANGALGANLNEISTLQDYLATVITWHRHIAGLLVQAKADIGNNVDGAQRQISILETDPELDAEQRQTAITTLVRETHAANTSLVAETAEQVLASKNWRPPKNALEDLLHQVTPPTPEVPTLVVPAPNTPSPGTPTPTPFEPVPANPYDPIAPGPPVTPGKPVTPISPVDPAPVTPVTPGVPVTPITPVNPLPPLAPVTPEPPVTPGKPVTPITPVNPKPDAPEPAQPVTPRPVTPISPGSPTPGPAPAPSNPATPAPGPQLPAAPGGPPTAPDQPGTPGEGGKSSPPATPGTEPAHVKPAAATDAPAAPAHGTAPSQHGDDTSAAVAPAAAGGMPAVAGRAGSAAPGAAAAAAGTSQNAGPAAASGAASRAASGRAPLGAAGRGPATPGTRPASARTAPPPTRPTPDHAKDKSEPADDVTVTPSIPVSAARAARDAIAAASRGRGGKSDPLRLARRVAAALNAPNSITEGDFGFFWITAVTTDGSIVVANSYGLAYIPEGVELPAKVYLASADRAMPPDEKARTATYPVLAVQGWAAFHDLKLRAVIGTAEQLANSDPGAAKIILEADDIPETGNMVGRSRLEVVDPSAAAQLADTDDLHLLDLLPAAPADANAPDDERHMLWFDLMKPMTSTAVGREVAHLRAFRAYAVHCQEIALHQAYQAGDAAAQRPAVADWLYWRHVAGLLDSALADAS